MECMNDVFLVKGGLSPIYSREYTKNVSTSSPETRKVEGTLISGVNWEYKLDFTMKNKLSCPSLKKNKLVGAWVEYND